MPQNIGTVVQIIGAVLDIKFPPEKLPNLLNAIEIEHEGKKLTVEVAQHIGDDTVRCIAMGSTDETKQTQLREEANNKIAEMLKKETGTTLHKVLFELSNQMKNAYSRSDA